MKIKIKDPVSAITHFIAMVLALIAATPLLLKASSDGRLHLAALTVFIISMVFLYAASTIYHTLDISPKINRLLKKIDHMMIFILIAGTYTPICLIVLGDKTGWSLLSLVWGIAISGIVIKACFIMCPKWFSSSLYIAMGWVCVLAFSKITETLSPAGFLWLLAGGIIYTI
ncbi:PAQR family membrane homeostasis protein TrhA, partial [Lacrimispora sp.]